MGLRFRKSVKICNGVKINFGKRGTSLTFGRGPLKKTFHQNGNVTTTIGIPGTGIYWTETERKHSTNPKLSESEQRVYDQVNFQNNLDNSKVIDDWCSSSGTNKEAGPESIEIDIDSKSSPLCIKELNKTEIKNLYLYADAAIDWTELISGATADEMLMDPAIYQYCVQQAPKVLSGNVGTYLEVIEKMCPGDDLALYSGDFEYGTNHPSYIEVEFSAHPEHILSNGTTGVLLKEFMCGIAIRVARDLFALLPILKTLIHVEINDITVLSVCFDRNTLEQINFKGVDAVSIVNEFVHLMPTNDGLYEVGRLTI